MPLQSRHHCPAGRSSRSASELGAGELRVILKDHHPAAPGCVPVSGTLVSIIIGYDAVTLREKVDLRAAGDRLDELGELRSLSALNEKVALLRLLGRLDEAMEIANAAVRQARFTGDRQELASSRIRRAQVLQFQGKLDEAALELGHCINESEAHEWNGVAASARENRGKVHFEQGKFEEALNDLTAAVFLREKDGAPADELESSLIAVAVVESFLEESRQAE